MNNLKKILILAFILFWGFSYSQNIDSIVVIKKYKSCIFLSEYCKKSINPALVEYIRKTDFKLYKRVDKATTKSFIKIDSLNYYCVYLGKKLIYNPKLEEMRNKPVEYHLIEYSYLSDGRREKTYLIDEK